MRSWGPKLQLNVTGSDNSLAPNGQRAIILNNNSKAYWRIYASLGLYDILYFRLLTCLTKKESESMRAEVPN